MTDNIIVAQNEAYKFNSIELENSHSLYHRVKVSASTLNNFTKQKLRSILQCFLNSSQ